METDVREAAAILDGLVEPPPEQRWSSPSEDAREGRPVELLREINATAAFNRWAGFELVSATSGAVTLAMPWREELGQYAGFLHAGMVTALADTACALAAVAVVGGQLLASH